MAKIDRIGSFGEIAPSKINYGSGAIAPYSLERMTYNSSDSSLSLASSMKYLVELQNSGTTKDVFDCPIRNWRMAFANLGDDLVIEIFDKKNNTLNQILVTGGHVSTFVWVGELKKGVFSYNNAVNPIVGESIIFIAGINKPMVYLDDDLTLKNWRVLTNQSETIRYITPIVEDFDIYQSKLSILVPNSLGTSTFEESLGIDTPWIYLSYDQVWDNFRQDGTIRQAIYIKPKNFEVLKYYSITAFRNILCVIHSGGLSVVKSGSASSITMLDTVKILLEYSILLVKSVIEETQSKEVLDKYITKFNSVTSQMFGLMSETLTQNNLQYYLADSSDALPAKAVEFNNVLMYLSRTGLRGRTLLEDPLTNQMTGFKIPVMSQRFVTPPTRIFKNPRLSQLCVFDGSTLFSFCEMVTTEGGGQLFPRTTYIKSDENFKVLAINSNSAVLEINGSRFLVEEDTSDILSIGTINHYYAQVPVVATGDNWIEFDIDSGLEKVMILIGTQWYVLIQSGTSGRFLALIDLPQNIPTVANLIPLEGKGVMTLIPRPMRNPLYQWKYILNGETVIISGDEVRTAIDVDPIIVSASKICAYALPMKIKLISTSTQYGPSTVQDLFLLTDKPVDKIGTFNHVPKIQKITDSPINEYSFKMSFSPTSRIFSLTLSPTLGQVQSLAVEQICCLI